MRWYYLQFDDVFPEGEVCNSESWVVASSCEEAIEALKAKYPDATKIAVRPHYGESPC